MRADLGPQRPQLGLDRPGPRAVELGELEVGADPAGDLVGGADQARRGLRSVRGQRPDDAVVGDEGDDDRVPDRAGQVAARHIAGPEHRRPPLRQHVGGVGDGTLGVGVAGAVPCQRAAGRRDGEGRCAEQHPQVPGRLDGPGRRQPFPQVRRGQGGGVQRRESRPVGGGAEVGAAADRPDRQRQRDRQHQGCEQQRLRQRHGVTVALDHTTPLIVGP
ncbi:MAG TPA: hypothetical protein VFD41_05945 [Actinomycetales bacterium]|nr:hypothetical protein [Actinomycetales bacterium]